MMSEDLEWTQAIGRRDRQPAEGRADRDPAIARGGDRGTMIKSDDKVTVIEEGDNIVIQSVSTEKVYVPRDEPAMLYDGGYPR